MGIHHYVKNGEENLKKARIIIVPPNFHFRFLINRFKIGENIK